jgi:hypothetical protein
VNWIEHHPEAEEGNTEEVGEEERGRERERERESGVTE